jgi:hypothetical protein
LLCAKTLDTDAGHAVAPHMDSGARFLSLQNGVDAVERIRAALAPGMAGPARLKHTAGRPDPRGQTRGLCAVLMRALPTSFCGSSG